MTLFRWKPACWFRVSGIDAGLFLQGQFTNDLRRLSAKPDAAIYGLWLTLKGKVLADSFILRGPDPDEYWIGSYFSSAAIIRERLESFIIADDVTIEDLTGEVAAVTILDVSAAEREAAGVGREVVWSFAGRRDRSDAIEIGYRVADGEPTALSGSSAPCADVEQMERRRIAAGIPAVPADIGPGDLPNEGGLDADAVSYTKGCYLGQEVMARLKSMGQVRRRLLRVAGRTETLPRVPAALFIGARQVGEVRSVAADGTGGWIGLAMLALMHVRPDTTLALSADGVPAVRLLDSP